MTKKTNQVFRVSVILKQDVQPLVLKQAIHDLKDRFPTFYVQLKPEFLRYKLITVEDTDVLTEESNFPCLPVLVGSGQRPMFRVLYIRNRISLEVFHLLTDGGGALCFLKNIVARYLELLGCQFENTNGVFDINEEPKECETEDSFSKLYQEGLKRISRSEAAAYQYRPEFKESYLNVVHGLIPVDELKKVTKAKGVTITEYLTAVYIYAFYLDMQPDFSKKPIKISAPVELRRLFDSITVRNFSLYANIAFYPSRNNYTFDEILTETVKGLKEGLNKEVLHRIASTNISDVNIFAYRIFPRILKDLILKIGYRIYGPRLMTTSFSNFGVVTVPKGIEEHIDHFEFMLGSGKKGLINCGAVSFGNILNITFASASEANNVQRIFFTFLSGKGINVSIQSNVFK